MFYYKLAVAVFSALEKMGIDITPDVNRISRTVEITSILILLGHYRQLQVCKDRFLPNNTFPEFAVFSILMNLQEHENT